MYTEHRSVTSSIQWKLSSIYLIWFDFSTILAKITTPPWNTAFADFPDTALSWFFLYSLGVPSQSSLLARLLFYSNSFFSYSFIFTLLYYVMLFLFWIYWGIIDKYLPCPLKQKVLRVWFSILLSFAYFYTLASENIYVWNDHKSIFTSQSSLWAPDPYLST